LVCLKDGWNTMPSCKFLGTALITGCYSLNKNSRMRKGRVDDCLRRYICRSQDANPEWGWLLHGSGRLQELVWGVRLSIDECWPPFSSRTVPSLGLNIPTTVERIPMVVEGQVLMSLADHVQPSHRHTRCRVDAILEHMLPAVSMVILQSHSTIDSASRSLCYRPWMDLEYNH